VTKKQAITIIQDQIRRATAAQDHFTNNSYMVHYHYELCEALKMALKALRQGVINE